MKIVADDKIPYIKGVLDGVCEMVYRSGSQISRADLMDADALMVRTRTLCNRALLEGTSVRLILTATIGYDHIDTAYCAERGIAWYNAAGCNALAVQQWVGSALSIAARERGVGLCDLNVGIVGLGHVGSCVKDLCEALHAKVYPCDPPKAPDDPQRRYYSLEELAERCDVITFHTPLTREGAYPTYHMAGAKFFGQLKRKPVILNAARGGVVDEQAARAAYVEGKIGMLGIDCWEHETDISPETLGMARIGTPHIAGYSADGKANASDETLARAIAWLGLAVKKPDYPTLPVPEHALIEVENGEDALEKILLAAYDIDADTQRLKASIGTFEAQRGDYKLRRDYGAYTVKADGMDAATWLTLGRIGFKRFGK